MAYVRAHETTQKRKGRPVKRYEVVWREPVRNDYGLPVLQPNGKTKLRSPQESFATREDAEARRDELNAAKHTGQTSALAEQKKAGDLPFGYYARELFESMRGTVKPRTLSEAEAAYQRYIADTFGQRAIATISAADIRHLGLNCYLHARVAATTHARVNRSRARTR